MNLDRECSSCRRTLHPGMYVFEVGIHRYCRGCVKGPFVFQPEAATVTAVVPAQRQPVPIEERPRTWGVHSGDPSLLPNVS